MWRRPSSESESDRQYAYNSILSSDPAADCLLLLPLSFMVAMREIVWPFTLGLAGGSKKGEQCGAQPFLPPCALNHNNVPKNHL